MARCVPAPVGVDQSPDMPARPTAAVWRFLPAALFPVATTWPAARSTLAFSEFGMGPLDSTLSRFVELGILNPADPLISCEWCDVIPGGKGRVVVGQRLSEICWHLVHCAAGNLVRAHASRILSLLLVLRYRPGDEPPRDGEPTSAARTGLFFVTRTPCDGWLSERLSSCPTWPEGPRPQMCIWTLRCRQLKTLRCSGSAHWSRARTPPATRSASSSPDCANDCLGLARQGEEHVAGDAVPPMFADGGEHAGVGVGPPRVLGRRQLRQVRSGADRPIGHGSAPDSLIRHSNV